MTNLILKQGVRRVSSFLQILRTQSVRCQTHSFLWTRYPCDRLKMLWCVSLAQLVAGDSVGREGYIRAIPRKERAPPVAPWEKRGEDAPKWEKLYPDFKGRSPLLGHQVLNPHL